MPTRMAAIVSLVVLAVCLVAGGIEAGNPFETVVLRAIKAMALAYVVGLAAGKAAQLMLRENIRSYEQKLKAEEENPAAVVSEVQEPASKDAV